MEQHRLINKYAICAIPIGILLNLSGGLFTSYIESPFMFNAIGTVVIAYLCGYLPSILVAFFSSAIYTSLDPSAMFYCLVSVSIALIASFMSRRKLFDRILPSILSVFMLAIVGSGIYSFCTRILFGLNHNRGASATLAIKINELTNLSATTSRFFARTLLDIVGKALVLVVAYLIIRIIPQKLKIKFPWGFLHVKTSKKNQSDTPTPQFKLTYSLRSKFIAIICATALILSLVSFYVSYYNYSNSLEEDYNRLGESAVNIMLMSLDANGAGQAADTDFIEAKRTNIDNAFFAILGSMPDIQSLSLVRYESVGCHILHISTLDQARTPKNDDVLALNVGHSEHISELILGNYEGSIKSSTDNGPLLSVYKPVRNEHDGFIAYAVANISVQDIVTGRYEFIIQMFTLLFGITIVIMTFVIWYAERKIISPINSIAAAADHIVNDSSDMLVSSINQFKSLSINTGDEIENLHRCMSKTVSGVLEYIELIDQKNQSINNQARFISQMQDNIIASFANIVESRDESTGSHIKRTAAYVSAIGKELLREGKYPDILNEEILNDITKSAPLHDIGKVKVPDSILNKPGKLTPEEFEIIKNHTTAGREIILESLAGIEGNNYLREAANMAGYHHERWDGTGYPEGLSGNDIPLCARIMAVADVFDALISKRSYKDALSFDAACDIIRSEAGTHFDPQIVDAFFMIIDEIYSYSQAYSE